MPGRDSTGSAADAPATALIQQPAAHPQEHRLQRLTSLLIGCRYA
jgi:hypothetical protein